MWEGGFGYKGFCFPEEWHFHGRRLKLGVPLKCIEVAGKPSWRAQDWREQSLIS